MRKFKVGDSIVIKKVLPQDKRLGIKKGDIGIIVELDNLQDNRHIVKMDKLPNPVPMLKDQMEHLTIDSSPSPDNPQEIKFPSISIGELDLNRLCDGYIKANSDGIKINSDSIKINSDSININVEKEKNNMEILDLYKKRKNFKIQNDFLINQDKILEEDEIQKIFKEMIEQVNVVLENEGSKPVDMDLPVQYKEFRTAKTNEKLGKLVADTDKLKDKLYSDYEEVKALLSMTNDYQEQIKILKNYGIIDKKTNKLNV